MQNTVYFKQISASEQIAVVTSGGTTEERKVYCETKIEYTLKD